MKRQDVFLNFCYQLDYEVILDHVCTILALYKRFMGELALAKPYQLKLYFENSAFFITIEQSEDYFLSLCQSAYNAL